VKVLMLIFPFFMDVILLPARWVLGFFLIIENVLPIFLSPKMTGGVAYGAHIGGFAAGLAVAYGLDRLSDRSSEGADESTPSPPPSSGPASPKIPPEDIRDAVRRHDLRAAAAGFMALESGPQRLAVSPDDTMRIGDHMLQTGRYEDAIILFRRYIADHPSGPYLDWACLGAGMALLHGRGERISAKEYFLQALDVHPSPKVEEEARRLIALIESHGNV